MTVGVTVGSSGDLRRWFRSWALLANACAILFVARHGEAQLPDAAYGDLKEVVSELLTAEVTESLVPQIACRAGRHVLGAVQPAPRDAIRLCRGTDGDGKSVLAPCHASSGSPESVRLLALHHYPQSLQRAFSRQFGALRFSLRQESADFAAYLVYLALREGTQPSGLIAKYLGEEAPADSAAWFGPLGDASLQQCSTAVRAKLVAGHFQTRTPSALDRVCADRQGSTTAYACALARAVRAGLLDDAGLAQENLVRASGWLLSEVLLRESALHQAQQANAGRDLILLALRDILTRPVDLTDGIVDELERRLIATFGDSRLSQAANLTRSRRIANAVARARPHLKRLRSQWELVTSSNELPLRISTFVDVLAQEGAALDDLCRSSKSSPQSCAILDVTRKALAPAGALGPLVQAAAQGNAREAAYQLVATLFPNEGGTDDAGDERARTALYRRFAASLALYVLAASEGDGPDVGTRGALRSAAVDLLRSTAPKGLERRWYEHLYIPQVGLRASWSTGYVNPSGDSFRYLAYVTFGALRAELYRGNLTYVGLEGSVLEPLTPLAELASRARGGVEYDKSPLTLWNALSPRVSLLIAMPAFSRRLAVGPSLSWRWAAPFEIPAARDPASPSSATPVRYEYRTPFRRNLQETKEGWSAFLEYGVFLNYAL